MEPEVDVADFPRSGGADECAQAGYGVDCVNTVDGPDRRKQRAIGRAHTETIITVVHRHGVNAVGVSRRDGVQRCEIKAGSVRQLIKRAIWSKTEPAAKARTGIAYERRNGCADVDGVQKAVTIEAVSTRAYPVEHARARLEAKIADTDRRPVIGDRADRGDQAAGIGINLDERAGGAKPGYGRGKEAAVGMEGDPG